MCNQHSTLPPDLNEMPLDYTPLLQTAVQRRRSNSLHPRNIRPMNCSFSHRYQGSIDFNIVNVQRNIGMYFLVFTGNRVDIGG